MSGQSALPVHCARGGVTTIGQSFRGPKDEWSLTCTTCGDLGTVTGRDNADLTLARHLHASATDPETGLPLIEVCPDLADLLTTGGWKRQRVRAENRYVMGCWTDGAYTVEPSGQGRAVYVHRGALDAGRPVLTMSPWTLSEPLPARVIVAAIEALRDADTQSVRCA